jgi:hypothetical protein
VGGVDAAAAGAAVAVAKAVPVQIVDAAAAGAAVAASAKKKRTRKQMDQDNERRRRRTAAKAAEKAAAPVLPAQAPVPSAGEGVDAAVKAAAPAQAPVPSAGEVGPSLSKRQKARDTAAKELDACIAAYGAGRGRATPAAPPRMRTCTRYLGRALAPTKIVMRPGGGGKPAQRYARRLVVRRGPLPAPAEGALAPEKQPEAEPVKADPALSMMMSFF